MSAKAFAKKLWYLMNSFIIKRDLMKNLKLIAVMIMVLSQSFILEAAWRRKSSLAGREIVTRSSVGQLGKGLVTPKTGTQVTCPQKGASQSIFTKSFSKSSVGRGAGKLDINAGKFSERRYGNRWGATLGVAGVVGATTLSDEEKQKQIQSDLNEFRNVLRSSEKERIIAFIEKLEKKGEINEKDEYKNTPMILVIRLGINDSEKAAILKLLIEHGAKPQENELKNAFGLTSVAAMPSESSQLLLAWADVKPKNEVLKVILPYYDQKTLSNLVDLAESKIIKINNHLEETLSKEHDYEKQLEYLLESREKLSKQPEEQKSEEISDIGRKIVSIRESIDIMKDRQEKFRAETKLFSELKTIAKESLYKVKFGTPQKEEAELK